MATLFTLLFLAGCGGDRCERLCRDVSVQLESCTEVPWETFGARSRSDFVVKCRADWERRSDDLTSSNLNEALQICADARTALTSMTCTEVAELYAAEE